MVLSALEKISYGLFILTTKLNEKINGCIINTLSQVSLTPSVVSVSVSKENLTCDMIKFTKKFCVSILDETCDFDTIKHFGFNSGKEVDKFANIKEIQLTSNDTAAVLIHTNAYIAANVINEIDLGSHILFIGEVVDTKVLNSNPSVTYSYYHTNIKPKPQKTVNTNQTVWRCKICGYEYIGEELPADYICPLCKHPASDFEKIIKE